MNSKMLKFTSIILFHIVSITVLLFTSSSEAVCVNKAVYDNCRSTGDSKLASCPPLDYHCLCDARKQIQLCFQQCQDDLDVQNERKAYEPAVQQFCGLAASDSSTTILIPSSSLLPSTVTPTVNQSSETTSFVPTNKYTFSSSDSSIPTTTTTATRKTTSNANKLSLSKPIVMFLVSSLFGYIVMI